MKYGNSLTTLIDCNVHKYKNSEDSRELQSQTSKHNSRENWKRITIRDLQGYNNIKQKNYSIRIIDGSTWERAKGENEAISYADQSYTSENYLAFKDHVGNYGMSKMNLSSVLQPVQILL